MSVPSKTRSSREIQIQCCFTSTEITIRTIRDREPMTATSTFAQLLSSAPEKVAMKLKRPHDSPTGSRR